MKLIRVAKVDADKRPDGREVRQLGHLKIDMFVDSIALLHGHLPARFEERQHRHDRLYELFYFLQDGRCVINGDTYDVAAGDIVVLEPGDEHGVVSTDHAIDLLILQIPHVPDDKEYVDRTGDERSPR